jgi:dynein heavy chain
VSDHRYNQNVEWLSALCGLVRGELTKLMRGSLVALITIDVHNRDIIDYLVSAPIILILLN